jgi:heptosyltransferase-2
MSIPALRELRRILPEAHIALHTRAWAEGIFRDADFLDEIIAYDKTDSSFADVIKQGKELRHKRFDVAIVFPNSFASALTMKLAGIPRRFGYSKDARRILLTDALRVPKWKDKRHEVFYYLNLISEVEKACLSSDTTSNREPVMKLPVSGQRREHARIKLGEFGVDPTRQTVALGVGSTNSRAKRWLPENYAKLNDLIQAELNANVILVGSKDESDVSDAVAEKSIRTPIVLTGKTNLDEATAILSEINMLVSNDMGLAHVAAAVGTKTMVIFGPTNPATTAPFSPRSHVIREVVECSPCMLRDCPIDHRCMTRISPERVFELVKNELTEEGS